MTLRCPYCENPVSIEQPDCCGEVHAMEECIHCGEPGEHEECAIHAAEQRADSYFEGYQEP